MAQPPAGSSTFVPYTTKFAYVNKSTQYGKPFFGKIIDQKNAELKAKFDAWEALPDDDTKYKLGVEAGYINKVDYDNYVTQKTAIDTWNALPNNESKYQKGVEAGYIDKADYDSYITKKNEIDNWNAMPDNLDKIKKGLEKGYVSVTEYNNYISAIEAGKAKIRDFNIWNALAVTEATIKEGLDKGFYDFQTYTTRLADLQKFKDWNDRPDSIQKSKDGVTFGYMTPENAESYNQIVIKNEQKTIFNSLKDDPVAQLKYGLSVGLTSQSDYDRDMPVTITTITFNNLPSTTEEQIINKLRYARDNGMSIDLNGVTLKTREEYAIAINKISTTKSLGKTVEWIENPLPEPTTPVFKVDYTEGGLPASVVFDTEDRAIQFREQLSEASVKQAYETSQTISGKLWNQSQWIGEFDRENILGVSVRTKGALEMQAVLAGSLENILTPILNWIPGEQPFELKQGVQGVNFMTIDRQNISDSKKQFLELVGFAGEIGATSIANKAAFKAVGTLLGLVGEVSTGIPYLGGKLMSLGGWMAKFGTAEKTDWMSKGIALTQKGVLAGLVVVPEYTKLSAISKKEPPWKVAAQFAIDMIGFQAMGEGLMEGIPFGQTLPNRITRIIQKGETVLASAITPEILLSGDEGITGFASQNVKPTAKGYIELSKRFTPDILAIQGKISSYHATASDIMAGLAKQGARMGREGVGMYVSPFLSINFLRLFAKSKLYSFNLGLPNIFGKPMIFQTGFENVVQSNLSKGDKIFWEVGKYGTPEFGTEVAILSDASKRMSAYMTKFLGKSTMVMPVEQLGEAQAIIPTGTKFVQNLGKKFWVDFGFGKPLVELKQILPVVDKIDDIIEIVGKTDDIATLANKVDDINSVIIKSKDISFLAETTRPIAEIKTLLNDVRLSKLSTTDINTLYNSYKSVYLKKDLLGATELMLQDPSLSNFSATQIKEFARLASHPTIDFTDIPSTVDDIVTSLINKQPTVPFDPTNPAYNYDPGSGSFYLTTPALISGSPSVTTITVTKIEGGISSLLKSSSIPDTLLIKSSNYKPSDYNISEVKISDYYNPSTYKISSSIISDYDISKYDPSRFKPSDYDISDYDISDYGYDPSTITSPDYYDPSKYDPSKTDISDYGYEYSPTYKSTPPKYTPPPPISLSSSESEYSKDNPSKKQLNYKVVYFFKDKTKNTERIIAAKTFHEALNETWFDRGTNIIPRRVRIIIIGPKEPIDKGN
jgi:hypothetical protein